MKYFMFKSSLENRGLVGGGGYSTFADKHENITRTTHSLDITTTFADKHRNTTRAPHFT